MSDPLTVGQKRCAKPMLHDSVVILNDYSARDSLNCVIVEFCDGDGGWHLLSGASVISLEPYVYEVTVADLAPMWLASPALLDGVLLRLDGRQARPIVNARREGGVLVLRASIERSEPRG